MPIIAHPAELRQWKITLLANRPENGVVYFTEMNRLDNSKIMNNYLFMKLNVFISNETNTKAIIVVLSAFSINYDWYDTYFYKNSWFKAVFFDFISLK